MSSLGAMPLGADFPFFDRAFARVQIAGEYRLANVIDFAEVFQLGGLDPARDGQMALVEMAHGRLVERADLVDMAADS